jgi:hypothetical protein
LDLSELKMPSFAETNAASLLCVDETPPHMYPGEWENNPMTEEAVRNLISDGYLDEYKRSMGCRACSLADGSPQGFPQF